MIRTYRGPIIERRVESGIVHSTGTRRRSYTYALAVDDGTGEIVLLYSLDFLDSRFSVSYYSPSTRRRMWTVTP